MGIAFHLREAGSDAAPSGPPPRRAGAGAFRAGTGLPGGYFCSRGFHRRGPSRSTGPDERSPRGPLWAPCRGAAPAPAPAPYSCGALVSNENRVGMIEVRPVGDGKGPVTGKNASSQSMLSPEAPGLEISGSCGQQSGPQPRNSIPAAVAAAAPAPGVTRPRCLRVLHGLNDLRRAPPAGCPLPI